MAEYLSPGIYVEEFNSGAAPVEGVGTSTAGFIGVSEKGPGFGPPVLITSFANFSRVFGGFLSEDEFGKYRYLAYAVNQFFINGGGRCFVKRVVPKDATHARNTDDDSSAPITVYAKEPGLFGNNISLTLTPGSKAKTQVIEAIQSDAGATYKLKSASGFAVGDIVAYKNSDKCFYNQITYVDGQNIKFKLEFDEDIVDTGIVPQKTINTCEVNVTVKCGDLIESYESLNLLSGSPRFINDALIPSELVAVNAKQNTEITPPYEFLTGDADGDSYQISLFGGSNGTAGALSDDDFIGYDEGPSKRGGIQSFTDNTEVSIIAAPGIVSPSVLLTLTAHCENTASRFAILDIPQDKKSTTDIAAYRDMFDTSYAAMYHPWVKVFDPVTKNNIAIPPSGSVAGVFARTDISRGVHKAPANEVVNACVGLDCNYTKGEQDILNPKGVNLIRAFSGQGIRIWGARTVSSDPLWKYVNIRRLFIFIEESIKRNTNWVVFEPNDQALWLRVRRTIEIFLGDLWRTGALTGASETEAFFVNIGTNTMTQGDIDNGRLICVIGVAPVKPAEFVIFRLTQHTASGS